MDQNQTNQYFNQNVSAQVTQSQDNLPKWVKVTFNIYGTFLLLSGIGALFLPFVQGFLLGAMGGGQEGFNFMLKTQSYLFLESIATLILAYGVFKKSKWIIPCIAISSFFSLVFSVLFFIVSKVELSVLAGSIGMSLIPLIIALMFKKYLKGKYFVILPVVLTIIIIGFAKIMTFNASKDLGLFETGQTNMKYYR